MSSAAVGITAVVRVTAPRAAGDDPPSRLVEAADDVALGDPDPVGRIHDVALMPREIGEPCRELRPPRIEPAQMAQRQLPAAASRAAIARAASSWIEPRALSRTSPIDLAAAGWRRAASATSEASDAPIPPSATERANSVVDEPANAKA